MTRDDKRMSDEFAEFLSSPGVEPSRQVSENILSFVRRELNPSRFKVFLKIIGIHSLVSLISLSICSQFGFQLFPVYDAMNAFMDLVGHTYCMILCGGLYLSMSTLVLGFTLKPEEIRVIRRDRYAQLLVLSGVSMGVLMCLGSDLLLLPAFLWFAGSVLGGATSLELGWLVRSKFRQRLIFGN